MTEAQRRSAAIKNRKARTRPQTHDGEPRAVAEESSSTARVQEQWIDEGPVDGREWRELAGGAIQRSASDRRTPRTTLDPEVAIDIADSVGGKQADQVIERLTAAADALERERFSDVRRILAPVLRKHPNIAAGHEMVGLGEYRLGNWEKAATALERAQELDETPETLPVLADCYRALGRHRRVEETWTRLKKASPRHEVMAEGRIVMAGSYADRGDLKSAISMLAGSGKRPKRIRDHHLRQWYALADLYDRSGDIVSARRWFNAVAEYDPQFVDVLQRLRALGR